MREIVFDTETTGLKARGGDRLVEIGCVEMVNRVLTGNIYHVYINPERDMPIEAFNVHGLSEEFLSDKPVFADVAQEFLDFVGQDTLVAHNASFDIGFMNAELDRLSLPPISQDRVVDTLELARRKHGNTGNTLDQLMNRYGVDNSRRVKHGALLDAELLAEVYVELLGGRQISLIGLVEEETDKKPAHLSVVGSLPGGGLRQRPVPLASRLTAEEKAAHEAFVSSMGDKALWLTYADESETSSPQID
ncbi:DNA polymerase III subunit epsilon [Xanthobacter sp. TB0139]|uniref:DNA polymerase III subunit epsilon n=1 Tax=Xanthobacter sp. TB0139 TaxID=3459178 RepID=UPI0040390953